MAYFHFDGFTLRTADYKEPRIVSIAEEWTKADPDHCDTTRPEFWFENRMGAESYLLEDKSGIVFFFKMFRQNRETIEFHIQFPPECNNPREEAERRRRVMKGMSIGLQWVEKILAFQDVSTLCFNSKSPTLIQFCVKHLGFTHEGRGREKRLVKRIRSVEHAGSDVSSGN